MSPFRIVAVALLVLTCGCQRTGPASQPPPQTTPIPAPVDTATREPDSGDDAAGIIRAYYRAIGERRYDDAYRLWASEGAASGKSLAAFRDGFGNTAAVDVEPGTPGPIGAAAGSRYVEIPVRITAVSRDSVRQAFTGTYTLRRSVVDGATPEQRAWRIYSAKIHLTGTP